eukprot:4256241-Alexandrium_andersonii.AAC.1
MCGGEVQLRMAMADARYLRSAARPRTLEQRLQHARVCKRVRAVYLRAGITHEEGRDFEEELREALQ